MNLTIKIGKKVDKSWFHNLMTLFLFSFYLFIYFEIHMLQYIFVDPFKNIFSSVESLNP